MPNITTKYFQSIHPTNRSMAPLPPTQRQKANIKLPFQRRWVLPTRPLTHKSYPRHLSLKPSRFAWPDPPNLISPIHDIFAAPSRQLGPRKPEANIGPRFLKHRARPKPLHCGLKSGRRVRGDVEMGDEVLNRVSEVGIEVEDLAVRSAVQWGVLEGLREEIAGEMDLDLVGDEEEVDYYDQDSEMGDGSEADGDNEQGGHDDNVSTIHPFAHGVGIISSLIQHIGWSPTPFSGSLTQRSRNRYCLDPQTRSPRRRRSIPHHSLLLPRNRHHETPIWTFEPPRRRRTSKLA